MKNRFYMHEFKYHDGECYVTFNIVDLNELKNESDRPMSVHRYL